VHREKPSFHAIPIFLFCRSPSLSEPSVLEKRKHGICQNGEIFLPACARFWKNGRRLFWRSRHFEKLKDDEIVENAKTFAKEVRENGLLLLSAQDGQEAERYAHLFRFACFLCESRRPFPQHRQCAGDGTKQELQEFPFGRSSDHEAAREADAPLLLASYNMFCTQDNIALPTKKPSKTESPDVTILFREL